MALFLGVDLGTTKVTALALDVDTGRVAACCGAPNDAETTAPPDKSRGYSEWDARRIIGSACSCLRSVATELGSRGGEVAGLGITGQQHGVVIVDDALAPLTPLINWQDRRANLPMSGSRQTYVQRAGELAGAGAPGRAGCRLAAGYMGVTLWWLKETGNLPQDGTACFLMDYFAATLTGARPVTDATCAASSGLFDVAGSTWDCDVLSGLGLPQHMFPTVQPSGDYLGVLIPSLAVATGLPAGLPVFVGIGDNQASFLGSVGSPRDVVLVNVGTGGQVATFTEQFAWHPSLETRPFPRGGYLLVSARLCGGASFAVFERFCRQVVSQAGGTEPGEALFTALTTLAASAPPGAAGLQCAPYFAGTRAQPELRGSFSGISEENFTPAHMARALFEGMAGSFHDGYEAVLRLTNRPCTRLVGAGNGLRENALLARLVADAFALPLQFSRHREEAAYGAALVAAVGAGQFPDLTQAGRIIHYGRTQSDPTSSCERTRL